jgi:hypothetical protein
MCLSSTQCEDQDRPIEDLNDVVEAELVCCMSYSQFVIAAPGCSYGSLCRTL